MSATLPLHFPMATLTGRGTRRIPMSEAPLSNIPRKKYVKAIGPNLRKLLWFVFAVTALLGANSAYLAGITFMEWRSGGNIQNYFYQVMFLVHLTLGLV